MTVVTVKFYRNKPPAIILTGGENIGVGKFERQLVNIYRAIGKSKVAARSAKLQLAQENRKKRGEEK